MSGSHLPEENGSSVLCRITRVGCKILPPFVNHPRVRPNRFSTDLPRATVELLGAWDAASSLPVPLRESGI
jgi:hypothetical protein